jgi:hypothetical protein
MAQFTDISPNIVPSGKVVWRELPFRRIKRHFATHPPLIHTENMLYKPKELTAKASPIAT